MISEENTVFLHGETKSKTKSKTKAKIKANAKKYTNAQKSIILREYAAGEKIVRLMRKYGIGKSAIYRWKERHCCSICGLELSS